MTKKQTIATLNLLRWNLGYYFVELKVYNFHFKLNLNSSSSCISLLHSLTSHSEHELQGKNEFLKVGD